MNVRLMQECEGVHALNAGCTARAHHLPSCQEDQQRLSMHLISGNTQEPGNAQELPHAWGHAQDTPSP
jgi:hypothetical protein